MANNNLQEPLKAFPPVLNHIVAKAIRKDLSRQRWDRNARRLSLQYISEVLEIGVSPSYIAMSELKGWYVRAAEDLVICVHIAAHAMSAGVLDLGKR
jgi:hypothetical protein